MSRSRAVIVTAAVLATLGASLTGCGSSSSPSATTTVTVSATPSGPSSAPAVAPTAVGDQQACAAMENVIARMTTAAAHWQPAVQPFDQRVRKKIRVLAQDMAGAERKAATGQVRAGVHESTVAFSSLASAMAGHKKGRVFDAVGKTQQAYRDLRQVCALG